MIDMFSTNPNSVVLFVFVDWEYLQKVIRKKAGHSTGGTYLEFVMVTRLKMVKVVFKVGKTIVFG